MAKFASWGNDKFFDKIEAPSDRLFSYIVQRAEQETRTRFLNRDSIKWYQRNLRKISIPAEAIDIYDNKEGREIFRVNGMKFSVGGMYQFVYDAKTKDKLPYWDACPIMIPFAYDEKNNRMFGYNLHYLAPRERGMLLDFVVSRYMKTNDLSMSKPGSGITANSRIKIDDLQGDIADVRTALQNQEMMNDLQFIATNVAWLKPCIHSYILSPKHIKSSLYRIPPKYWAAALFLPTERFQKKSASYVWAQSAKKRK